METNNVKKMREALEDTTNTLERIFDAFSKGTGGVYMSDVKETIDAARAALSVSPTDDEEPPGNATALREALERALEAYCNATGETIHECAAALETPPRNCDVGGMTEQTRRYEAFCDGALRKTGCKGCPANARSAACKFAWAQMPFEAPAGEAKEGGNE